MKIIKGINENEVLTSIDWSYEQFKNVIDFRSFFMILMSEVNWSNSLKLTDDGELCGLYLLGDQRLKTNKFKDLFGVKGVLLAVDENYRGCGYGKLLKNEVKIMGYYYIWGEQLKTLNNINHWLKTRELVLENNDLYITAEIFKK